MWESHAECCTGANTVVEFGGYAPGPVLNLISRNPLATPPAKNIAGIRMAPSSSAMEFNGSKVS